MNLKRLSLSLEKAAKLIINANFSVALTGAGSSTPSGISDFRSKGSGLWNRFSPDEVASLKAFRQNPQQFFKWIKPLVNKMLAAEPNPAHFALAHLEKNKLLNTIITQNIDGLHQRAGSVNVLQVHGTLKTMTCIGCYQQVNTNIFTTPFINDDKIPQCNYCGNTLKPDVILFGEQLPAQIWMKARKATNACDLMIVAGTSLVVSPVAQLPEQARKNGARIIIVNKSPTYMDEYASLVIHGDVANILPKITRIILNE
ncbi:NAD-dependent deacetylase [Chloroflexota bacterium]